MAGPRLLISLLMVSASISGQSQDGKLPIIDMHQHAWKIVRIGNDQILPRPCMPEPCDKIPAVASTDEDILKRTLQAMEKFNIVKAVLSDNDADQMKQWRSRAPERFIPGLFFFHPVEIDISWLRNEIKAGNIKVLGEIATQYSGLEPDDPILEPYFSLAEEFDIPVQMHVCGAGGPYHNLSLQAGNPLHLDNVLRKHPKLRIYLENAGWPFTEEMTSLMFRYDNVYGDLSTCTWIIPKKPFYRHLKGLMDMGLGKRLMFGSDQMMWPETIEAAIQTINSADFLSQEQKRDIFYNNAARFLKLSNAEIAKHYSKK